MCVRTCVSINIGNINVYVYICIHICYPLGNLPFHIIQHQLHQESISNIKPERGTVTLLPLLIILLSTAASITITLLLRLLFLLLLLLLLL